MLSRCTEMFYPQIQEITDTFPFSSSKLSLRLGSLQELRGSCACLTTLNGHDKLLQGARPKCWQARKESAEAEWREPLSLSLSHLQCVLLHVFHAVAFFLSSSTVLFINLYLTAKYSLSLLFNLGLSLGWVEGQSYVPQPSVYWSEQL